MIACFPSVSLPTDWAVQKAPPAMTPIAATAEMEIRNMRHPPQVFAHVVGEHSNPTASSTWCVTGGGADFMLLDELEWWRGDARADIFFFLSGLLF